MNEKKALLQQAQEIQKLIRRMNLTLDPLQADLDFTLAEWSKNEQNQFWRRTLVRCLLALTEALLWNMKRVVPKVAAVSGNQLSADELSVATEKRVTTRNGKLVQKQLRLKFRDNVRATFSLFGKVHGVAYELKADKDFDAFCATYELRSRLMHPKEPFDPNVSNDDILVARRGVAWLMREWGELMTECTAAVPRIVKR